MYTNVYTQDLTGIVYIKFSQRGLHVALAGKAVVCWVKHPIQTLLVHVYAALLLIQVPADREKQWEMAHFLEPLQLSQEIWMKLLDTGLALAWLSPNCGSHMKIEPRANISPSLSTNSLVKNQVKEMSRHLKE